MKTRIYAAPAVKGLNEPTERPYCDETCNFMQLKYATISIGFHIISFPYESCFAHFNMCLDITTHNFKGDLSPLIWNE